MLGEDATGRWYPGECGRDGGGDRANVGAVVGRGDADSVRAGRNVADIGRWMRTPAVCMWCCSAMGDFGTEMYGGFPGELGRSMSVAFARFGRPV